MKIIRHIIVKEFRQILRNKIMLRIMFVLPIIQLLVLSYAVDFEIRKIYLGIIDSDKSPASQLLINKFTGSGYFTTRLITPSANEALDHVEKENLDVILVIPKDFEKDITNIQSTDVQVLANAVNNQKAAIAVNYASAIISLFNRELMQQHPSLSAVSVSFEFSDSYWYNPSRDYKTFMVPGILAVLLTMLTAFLSSMNIIREKESGTIEQLNVTPIHKYEFIIGKLLPFLIIGIIILTIGLFIAYYVFGIGISGNIQALYSFAGLFIIAMLGMGNLISTIANTQQQALFITWFFTVIFILMSGLFTPRDGMPEWAHFINYGNPLKYFVDVIRMVMLKGSGFRDLTSRFAIMFVFAAGLNVLAIWNYRKVTA
jgi:ABC-2 type transport system permease protein